MSFGILGIFVILLTKICEVTEERPAAPEYVQEIWHRYEVGDLTRSEFERLRTGMHALGIWRPSALSPEGSLAEEWGLLE